MTTFKRNLQKHGCPIKPRRLLLGHIGWVNAVAIENTTVVSGGSDHTVRIWDALSGRLIRLIPNLFFNRPVGHGVYTVAIHGSLIGSGSIIEGYQIHDLETGQLMIDMDEPLSSKDHVQFESLLYQQYASRMVITDTVVVTNSKKEGMLCVWDRQTGMFMYRIQVCPQSSHAPGSSSSDGVRLPNLAPMVTFSANDSNANLNRITGDDPRSELTVHTFQINKSGSMLMCTLCNGRVSLIDFGSAPSALIDSWEVRASGHGVLVPVSGDVGPMEQHEEHQCGTLAWVWMRGSQGRNRVVLV
ncbi:Kinesin-like protein kif21b [Mortierella sp. AM989]|nr:Kinesin-like protein kif21b [Mortierella sp. AM989]